MLLDFRRGNALGITSLSHIGQTIAGFQYLHVSLRAMYEGGHRLCLLRAPRHTHQSWRFLFLPTTHTLAHNWTVEEQAILIQSSS